MNPNPSVIDEAGQKSAAAMRLAHPGARGNDPESRTKPKLRTRQMGIVMRWHPKRPALRTGKGDRGDDLLTLGLMPTGVLVLA